MKESAQGNANYLRSSRFYPITIICIASFLLSFISVPLSTLLGIGLSFYLIMRGRPNGILGLFFLYFIRYYFYNVSDFISSAGALTDEFRESIAVAGIPLSVESVACGFICLRVLLEGLFMPKTYITKFPKILFSLWIVAFLPVLVGTCLSYQIGNVNWSGGLRFMMITGSYFYGYILSKHWPQGRNGLLIPILLPLAVIMLLLMNLKVYWSHHGYLFLGLGGSFSIYFIRKRSLLYKSLGMLMLCLVLGYATKGSITTLLTALLSIFLSCLVVMKQENGKRLSFIIRNYTLKFAGVMAILSVILFTVGVIYVGHQNFFDVSMQYGSDSMTYANRFVFKTLSDRLPIWLPAFEQVISGPYFIVPSNRPILGVPGFPEGWLVGSHNTILEALRMNGLFAGTVMLVILFWALKQNLMVLKESADPVLRCMAAGILGVGISGMTLNQIPIDMTMGFWLWSLAGLCHGLFLQEISMSESRRLRAFRQGQPNGEAYACAK